jgi:hypothetical protein
MRGWLLVAFLATPGLMWGQDSLLDLLNETAPPQTNYTTATFKGTRVINGASVEMPAPGVLQFMIRHRFGAFNDDFFYNFFGLDNANIRLSLDYSVNRWLNIGIGRSSLQKMVDGDIRVKLFRQKSGAENFPLTIVYHAGAYRYGIKDPADVPVNNSDRWRYMNELLIARKFNERLSVQLSPGIIHYNLVETRAQPNTYFYLGAGARFKLTNRLSLNAEYYWLPTPHAYLNNGELQDYDPSFSLGLDIETGGHVFQLHFSNALGHVEPQFITETRGTWGNGDIRFGFNISRVFTVVKPKIEGAQW